MFFCDLLRCMRGRSYLNCVTNRVCDYFFRARRDALRHIATPLKEFEMQYAESRMKELEKAVFMLKVKMYKWHTFTAEKHGTHVRHELFPFPGEIRDILRLLCYRMAPARTDLSYHGRHDLPSRTYPEGSGRAQPFPFQEQLPRFLCSYR